MNFWMQYIVTEKAMGFGANSQFQICSFLDVIGAGVQPQFHYLYNGNVNKELKQEWIEVH